MENMEKSFDENHTKLMIEFEDTGVSLIFKDEPNFVFTRIFLKNKDECTISSKRILEL